MSRLLGLGTAIALMTACSLGHQEGGELDSTTAQPEATAGGNAASDDGLSSTGTGTGGGSALDSGTVRDTGPIDTGPIDTGTIDTGTIDTGTIDTGTIDTGPIDSTDI